MLNSNGQSSRIEGLDVWRAILLLFGPAVHAATWTGSNRALDTFVFASHLFRMETFFVISGLLASINMLKRRPGWLRVRLHVLGIPLLFVWFVLLPETGYIADNPRNLADPMHTWFLLVLILATLFVWHRLRDIKRFHHDAIVVTALLTVVAAIAGRSIGALGLPGGVLVKTLLLVPYYTGFYVMGYMLARCEAACALIHRGRYAWLGWAALVTLVAGFALTYPLAIRPDSGLLFKLARTAVMAVAAMLLSYSILVAAYRVRRAGAVARYISRASYTVYLLHVSVLILLVPHLGTLDWPARFATLAIAGLAIPFAADLLVQRSALLRLLLNGKIGDKR